MVNLKFWEKNDDPFASDTFSKDLSQEFHTPTPAPLPATDPFAHYTPDNPPPGMSFVPAEPQGTGAHAGKSENNWQYDVIIARLDSIKSQLDMLNHRMERLEREEKTKKDPRGPWYTK